MKEDNLIQQKSFAFALRIVRLFRFLTEEMKEFVLAKQVMRSGTSIGANIEEAIGAQSQRDFLSKISIAYKEARETKYWLNLLKASNYLDTDLADSLLLDTEELLKILGSIQIKLKSRNS
jgi:four helix bundle protein